MFAFWLRFQTLFLLYTLMVVEATDIAENGTLNAAREPRVTGRIVKLYSGTRPEPISCTGEGFEADPHDCTVFYRCMKSGRGKFTVYKFSCGTGTVYDPETEVCNHPRSTKRTECGGFIPPPNTTEHENMNEIEDIRDVPSPITTKHPIYFIQATTTTTTAIKPPTLQHNEVATFSRPVTLDVAYLTTNKPIVFNQQQSEKTIFSDISQSTTQTLSNHISYDNNCQKDGFMGDTENCRKFYRCVANQNGGYTRHEFLCSEATLWDEDSQGCNHAWAVKRSRCGRHNLHQNKLIVSNAVITTEAPIYTDSFATINQNEHDQTVQQQLQISYGSKVTQTQTQISNGSVIQNQTQIHYDEKADQIKTSEVKQNQTQLSHDSAISQTQTQIDYGNKGIQTQLQVDHSIQSSQSQTQLHESSTNNAISTSTTKQNGGHDKVCTQSGFVGDKNDCKKFYRCVDNGRGHYTKYEFSCSDGTVWDQEIEACNHAWAVKQCGGSVSQSDTTTEIINTANSKQPTLHTTTYQPMPNYETTHSTKHDYSTNALITDSDDDNNGYGNNNVHSTMPTTVEVNTTTQTASVLGTECKSSGFMGSEHDCKVFYRCVEKGDGTYTKYEFKCGEGTVWDPQIEACNHAWAVEKCGGSVSQSDSTTKIINTASSKQPTLQTTTYKPMPNYETTHSTKHDYSTNALITDSDDDDNGYGNNNVHSTMPTTVEVKTTSETAGVLGTECKSSGFMGSEHDCKVFYRCVEKGDGTYTKYEFKCGEGTVWDPQIEACNHAWAVEKCGGSVSQSDSTTKIINTASSKQPTLQTTTYKPMPNYETTHSTKHDYSTNALITDSDDDDNGYGNNNVHSTMPTTVEVKTTSETAGVLGTECKSSGFMGSEHDCKVFYRCVEKGDGTYTKYEFKCGEGTVWDPKNEACNHAWAVEKCGKEANTGIHHETSSEYIPSIEGIHTTTVSPVSNQVMDSTVQVTTETLVTNIVSSKDNECSRSGFMGDQKDCKKFYRCVENGNGSFIRYEFSCGEGTLWDQTIEACNHASEVKKCGYSATPSTTLQPTGNTAPSSGPTDQGYESSDKTSTTEMNQENSTCTEEGYVSDKYDCKKFYRCVSDGQGNYKKYEFTCGDGTYWNHEILSCDHLTSEKSCTPTDDDITTKTPRPENDEMLTASTISSNSTTEISDIGYTTQKQDSAETCNSEGFYGDNNDCGKFYRCVDNGRGGYTKYDFTCSEGTIWDQEMQACNHESPDNKCTHILSTTSSQSSSTSSTSTTEFENYSDKTEIPTALANSTCSSEGFFAVEYDCQKFIRCVTDGKGGFTKYEFTCGEGTVWIQDILACDHDDGSLNCSLKYTSSTTKPQDSNVPQTTSKVSTTHSQLQTEITETPEKLENGSNDGFNKPINATCKSEGFYGYENDCKRFFRCVSNGDGNFTKYDFTCGEGTGWDHEIQGCNHINQVTACKNTNIHSTTTVQPIIHDESTDKSTGATSATTSKTTTTSQLSTNIENTDKCFEEGYFGDKNDCKRFYRCVDNGKGGYTKYEFACGDGTIWDQDITTCNHPQDVTNSPCYENQGESTSETTTSTEKESPSGTTTAQSISESPSGGTSESSSQGSSNCSKEDASTNPQVSNVNCTKAGFYPNPNDCKKFYRCVDWDGDGKRFSVYHFECGEGTIWDPSVETCNHEESVYPPRNCNGTQSQVENVNQETTTTESSTTEHGEYTTTQSSITQQTTQASTPTDGTTTTQQETTTSQSTTTQRYPSEQTTTENLDQTTNEQATTTEQTTTEHATTAQQTTQSSTSSTTQQSTTSEGTTTEQTTTQEPTTTTDQSTAKTTTEESTATVQTTTQQSTTETSSIDPSTVTTEPIKTTTEQSTTTSELSTMTTEPSSMTTEQSTTTTEQSTATTGQSTATTGQGTTTTGQSTTTKQSYTDETTSDSGTQSTTDPSTIEQSTTSESTEESSPKEECPETDGDQYLFVCPTSFRRHPKYCNMFYQCTEDDAHDVKIATFTCPNNTIYDESKTKCVEENQAEKKCQGEIAQKQRFKRIDRDYKEPILASTQSYACPSPGYYPFENAECSPAFLKCTMNKSKKLLGYVYQCPSDYIYWSVSKRCERIQQVATCERSSNNWTGRWEIPIEKRNIAA